jgi:hypothetical protein
MTHARNRTRTAVTFALSALVVSAVAIAPAAPDAMAAEPFGPIESRTFTFHAGTTIEASRSDCHWNSDYLFIRGPNVAATKQADAAPPVFSRFTKPGGVPTTDCAAPNCVQLYVGVDKRHAPGPRTVTLKHPDGRTLTTTFDVIPNAGRCDTP